MNATASRYYILPILINVYKTIHSDALAYPDVKVYKHTMNAVLIHQSKTLITAGYRAVLNDMSGWTRKG